MNVLFVSAESVPFAKVGGMADVVGSLPGALRRLGIDARVVIPGYGFINHDAYNIKHLFTFQSPLRDGLAEVKVYTTTYDGVPIYFLQSWPYFGNENSVYSVWDWDSPRFIYFNQIVMSMIWEFHHKFDWMPNVLHVNDWHSGLLPFLIHENRHKPIWKNIATVLSIHNIAYQGDNAGGWLWKAGVPGRHQPDLVYQDLTDNILAIAIAYSDVVSTVSPRYATEIQYPYMGYDLDSLIRTRKNDLYGILNGIDTDLWNPETDPKLDVNYNSDTFIEKRAINKRHLQKKINLDAHDDVMLIGIVSRLVWQKGIDFALPALRRFLAENGDVQLVVLGVGDPEIERELALLGADFSWKARCFLEYDGTVAQLIYAGADLFLMPSHFEPCGMGQMMAMRYGSLPLVRETGGLADTVENYDGNNAEHGTGFTFRWEESEAVLGTLRWALNTYRNHPGAWRRMQKRGMQSDFSWGASAKRYSELYQKVVSSKKGH